MFNVETHCMNDITLQLFTIQYNTQYNTNQIYDARMVTPKSESEARKCIKYVVVCFIPGT